MTLYEVLGVTAEASAEEIKAAYRRRVKETHPDAAHATADTKEFRRVQAAYDVLGDEERRAKYDREGDDGQGESLAPSPTSILIEAFGEVLNMLENVHGASPIDLTRLALQERAKVELARVKKHEREVKRWRAIMEKLVRKEGAEAILEHVLQGKIEPHVRAAAQATAWAEGCQLALRLLEAYRYRSGASEFFELAEVLAGLNEDEGDGCRQARRKRRTATL